jgi:AtzH-like/Amidase
MVEGASLHLERLRHRAADFDPDVRDRLIAGAMLPGSWVVRAQKFRSWFRAQALRVFADFDILLAPATPCRAPLIGQKTMVLDGREMLVRPNIGLFTQPISFIGLPVATVPLWTAGETLPIGVQIIAPPWREDLAVAVARRLERDGVAQSRVAGQAPCESTNPPSRPKSKPLSRLTSVRWSAMTSKRSDRFFAPSECAIRYGVGENLYGFAEIKAFRAGRSPVGLARKLEKTRIVAYGRDLAIAATLFRRDSAPGKVGRQMQTWVRFAEGWRIVAAHVSLIDDPGAA